MARKDDSLRRVLSDVVAERHRQLLKYGDTHLRDGTGGVAAIAERDRRQRANVTAMASGLLTWSDVLREETAEVYAETDPVALRAELTQVAAVAAAWIEDIDSRTPSSGRARLRRRA
jgi:hypothetical protein